MNFEIKRADELNFVKGSQIYPSVEVDTDSLEKAGINDAISELEDALKSFSETGAKAAIYSLETQSINFGVMCNSIFFGVAGSKKILEIIHKHFSKITNVNVRFSEYIPRNQTQIALHVEFGTTWTAYEIDTWRSASNIELESVEISDKNDIKNIDEQENTLVDDEDNELRTITKLTQPLRQRAARSTAKVGTIRATIEEIFGLPIGSVQLCDPEGRQLRAHALIRTLRQRWE
jgi:hypothetical protein